MTYTPITYNLDDLDDAFALLSPEQVAYAISQGLTFDRQMKYVDTHWLYKDETPYRRFEMAIGILVESYRAIANDTYGLRD
jgi:hypothetical protein